MRTLLPGGLTRRFTYPGVTVAVESDEPAALAWLEEFLGPAFETGRDGPADCAVRLATDPARHARIRRRGPDPAGGRVVAFVRDDRVATCAAWGVERSGRSVLDDSLGAFYEVSEDGARVEVVTEGPSPASRVALMRVVRELALSRIRLRTGLVLHGAALASLDRGIVIAGPKGAGKTTLALHTLRAHGVSLVANDRVWVDLGAAPARVRGVPTIVSIRPSTLEHFPTIRERLGPVGDAHSLTVAEARAAARRPSRKAPSVTAAQLCDALGVGAAADAGVACVVFPRVTGEPGGIAIEPVAPATAAGRLMESLFHAAAPAQVSEVFRPLAGARVPDAAVLQERCAALAGRIPCYEARLGRDAYRDPASAGELVRRLTSDATVPRR